MKVSIGLTTWSVEAPLYKGRAWDLGFSFMQVFRVSCSGFNFVKVLRVLSWSALKLMMGGLPPSSTGWGFLWRGLKGICTLIEFKVRERKKTLFFLHKSSLKLSFLLPTWLYRKVQEMWLRQPLGGVLTRECGVNIHLGDHSLWFASRAVEWEHGQTKRHVFWWALPKPRLNYSIPLVMRQVQCFPLWSEVCLAALFFNSADHTEFCTKGIPVVQVTVELAGVGCLCSQLCSNSKLGEGVSSECFFGHQKP